MYSNKACKFNGYGNFNLNFCVDSKRCYESNHVVVLFENKFNNLWEVEKHYFANFVEEVAQNTQKGLF